MQVPVSGSAPLDYLQRECLRVAAQQREIVQQAVDARPPRHVRQLGVQPPRRE
jgi:hypothetical protein